MLLLADRGFITLDVEYIDGTKIESKANKYTFVWRKTVEKNRARLQEKIRVLQQQIDEVIAQDKSTDTEVVEFTPEVLTSLIGELKEALAAEPEPKGKHPTQRPQAVTAVRTPATGRRTAKVVRCDAYATKPETTDA